MQYHRYASNVHTDSPSRSTNGVQRNTSGYVLPQNELARFLTIGPTLVHAYFSITFSIQYPERGTRRNERERELSLTPSHCPRESICYCFCVCGRRGERSERGCISVGGKPGDQHEVGGGEYGCQSRSRCFKATLFGPTKRRPGRANCAGVVSYHQIGQEERESRGKRALSKLERDGQIDTCS